MIVELKETEFVEGICKLEFEEIACWWTRCGKKMAEKGIERFLPCAWNVHHYCECEALVMRNFSVIESYENALIMIIGFILLCTAIKRGHIKPYLVKGNSFWFLSRKAGFYQTWRDTSLSIPFFFFSFQFSYIAYLAHTFIHIYIRWLFPSSPNLISTKQKKKKLLLWEKLSI